MMTRGTKRLAESASSAPDSNDSALQSKRVMAAPNFDVHRAESPNNHTMEAPQLDAQRAQSCHLHVRALNTQYASWVQSQLQNHPDELWQDGAQDYINHASHIMEKFSDVVAWLRAKSSKAEGDSIASLADNQKLVDGAESSIFKSRPEMNILSTPVVSVSSTPNLFSSIQTSDNQKPLFPGSNLSLTPLMSGMPDGNFLSRVHQVETCRGYIVYLPLASLVVVMLGLFMIAWDFG